jgi:Fe-S cluster assembly iron-binding protein IscA
MRPSPRPSPVSPGWTYGLDFRENTLARDLVIQFKQSLVVFANRSMRSIAMRRVQMIAQNLLLVGLLTQAVPQ